MVLIDTTQCILIVDDQPANLHLLREAIAGLAEIYFAIDGNGAIAKAKQLRPALIILDIEMPGMDGYAVLNALRADPNLDDCLVIFITAHERGRHELPALNAGGIDFLSKPLDLPIARARIGNLLKLSMAKRQLLRVQQDMEAVFFHLPAFVAQWDMSLQNLFCNDRNGDWFGIDATQMRGRTLGEVFGPTMASILAPQIASTLEQDAVTFDLEFSGPDRTARFGQVALVCQRQSELGQPAGLLMLITDLTARRSAELALLDEQERIRVTLNSIGDAVITTDPAGLVTFCNPIAESMTGWFNAEALGRPIEHVMPLSVGVDGHEARNPIRLALAEQRIVGMAMDCRLHRRDGRSFAVEDSAAPILDHAGIMRGAIIVFHDVSEARAMAVKMSHLANHDALTNLPNRMLLRDRCEQALHKARRHGGRIAMLTIDLDHFKVVNATAGYGNGDLVLQQVAQRLTSALRGSDTLSRQGGDEFLVLLTEIGQIDEVNEFCARLRELIKAPFQIDQHTFSLTASVGIALYPDDSADVEQMYSHADSAIFRAKRDGRNRFRYFSQELEDSMRTRVALEHALGVALSERQFEVYYQPKINLATGKIVGAEALVRWNCSSGKVIGPSDFISLMEDNGQIVALGQFVLEEACRAAQNWRTDDESISVAVNVSPRQLAEEGFVYSVRDVLERTGFAGNRLQLEITEGAMVNELTHTRASMACLKKMGVLIAIDDFGTGYSSLTYLKRFPIDVLKVDQSFVHNMIDDSSDRAIIAAIIHMAASLNLQLVAEGVEHPDQAEMLMAMGCKVVQGYLYGRPMPLTQFNALLGQPIK